MDTADGSGRARAALSTAAVCLIAAALALAVAEAGARLLLPEVADTLVAEIASAQERYHHAPKFTLDPVDPNATRIAFLGDSFTYGMCPRDRTYPRLVERFFRAGSVPGVGPRAVQTFNLGTPSYSPSIYGAVLRDYVPRLRPHLVVIAVDDSDPQDDYWYRPMLVRDDDGLPLSVYPLLPGVPRWLVPVARDVKLLRVTLGVARQGGFAPRAGWLELEDPVFGAPAERLAHYDPAKAPAWAPRFAYTLELVDAIVRYCRRQGIAVAIVNYPYPPAVTTRHCLAWRAPFGMDGSRLYEPAFHAVQAQWAREHGVPYYDFTPHLRAMGNLDGVYNEADGHFTVLGNALFATELVRFLAPLLATTPAR